MDDTLDHIINDIKNDNNLQTLTTEISSEHITDDNLNQFIIDKMGSLIDESLEFITQLKTTFMCGAEPEEINAFCNVINTVTNATNTLNKINIQNKKEKVSKELKVLDNKNKLNSPANVLIATREEIINNFVKKNFKQNTIDITDDVNIEDVAENADNEVNENE